MKRTLIMTLAAVALLARGAAAQQGTPVNWRSSRGRAADRFGDLALTHADVRVLTRFFDRCNSFVTGPL